MRRQPKGLHARRVVAETPLRGDLSWLGAGATTKGATSSSLRAMRRRRHEERRRVGKRPPSGAHVDAQKGQFPGPGVTSIFRGEPAGTSCTATVSA